LTAKGWSPAFQPNGLIWEFRLCQYENIHLSSTPRHRVPMRRQAPSPLTAKGWSPAFQPKRMVRPGSARSHHPFRIFILLSCGYFFRVRKIKKTRINKKRQPWKISIHTCLHIRNN
jgi:hypothetical protein